LSFETPMLYAFGFIGLFTIGGLTGLFLATMAIDVHVTDTYFVIAHFHYVMVGGMVMAYLGGIHFWFPKMTGRMYPETWARFAADYLRRIQPDVLPAIHPGLLGMPRRYATYPPEFQVLNVMSTAGASILGFGYLIPMIYLAWAWRNGPKSPQNPWHAKGLEWEQSPTPPPTLQLYRATRRDRSRPTTTRNEEVTLADVPAFRYMVRIAPCTNRSYAEAPLRRQRSSSWNRPRSACGSSCSPRSCSSAECSGLYGVSKHVPGSLRLHQPFHECHYRRDQYRCADLQQFHDGAGRALRAARAEEGADCVPDPDLDPGLRLPGPERQRISREMGGAPHPRPWVSNMRMRSYFHQAQILFFCTSR
jgi:hypothetical protein